MPAYASRERPSSSSVAGTSTIPSVTCGAGNWMIPNGQNSPNAKRPSLGPMYAIPHSEAQRRHAHSSRVLRHSLPLRRDKEGDQRAKRCHGLHNRETQMDQDPLEHQLALRPFADSQATGRVAHYRRGEKEEGEEQGLHPWCWRLQNGYPLC
jgi:hypothetical protein